MGLTWGQAILHSNPHHRNVFIRKTFEFYSRFRTEETETHRKAEHFAESSTASERQSWDLNLNNRLNSPYVAL